MGLIDIVLVGVIYSVECKLYQDWTLGINVLPTVSDDTYENIVWMFSCLSVMPDIINTTGKNYEMDKLISEYLHIEGYPGTSLVYTCLISGCKGVAKSSQLARISNTLLPPFLCKVHGGCFSESGQSGSCWVSGLLVHTSARLGELLKRNGPMHSLLQPQSSPLSGVQVDLCEMQWWHARIPPTQACAVPAAEAMGGNFPTAGQWDGVL